MHQASTPAEQSLLASRLSSREAVSVLLFTCPPTSGRQTDLERRSREPKDHGRSKSHPDEAFWETRFGCMLEK